MELVQGFKTEPGILSSENHFQITHVGEKGDPFKCVEVYKSDRSSLSYVCLLCGKDFSKALPLEEHLHGHFVKIAPINNTSNYRSHIETSKEDTCEASGQLETTESNQEDFGAFIKTEPSETEDTIDIIEDDATIKEIWFTKSDKCENNFQTTNVGEEVYKCAEVYKSVRGGLSYFCLFCGKNFPKALQLEDHLLKHLVQISCEDASIEKPWLREGVLCEHCEEMFYCPGLANIHNRQKHNISFSHYCQQCNAGFDVGDTFKRHKELHKRTVNHPTCSFCKQIFESHIYLNEHLLYNRGENGRKQRYHCHLCAKTFATQWSRSIHQRKHTEGNTFKCFVCFAQYKKWQLKSHIKTCHPHISI